MGTALPYRKQNVVGRASYGYDSRYMLEASFGASGSENFSAGHRWGIFPPSVVLGISAMRNLCRRTISRTSSVS